MGSVLVVFRFVGVCVLLVFGDGFLILDLLVYCMV